jgi:RNA polymerase sigma-70 factor (sigma-E family)
MVDRDAMASPADAALFDRLVERESAALQRLAWGLTGDRAGAEDLVQAALERVWTRWHRVQDKNESGGYARRVIVSIFLTSRRRRWWAEHATASPPDRGVSDETDAIVVRQSVIAALTGLPIKQRAVIVLRYLDDRTEAQTAEALGCSIGTVKSHTSRALAALRNSSDLAGLWHTPGTCTKETHP